MPLNQPQLPSKYEHSGPTGPWSPGRDSTSPSPSNKEAATARTLNELYFGALERFGSRPIAVRAKRDGAWYQLSYRELADRVQDLSLGLLELGIHPGDRIAILSENRPEWAIADYACLAARCTDVPIYPTLPAKQVEYNLCDSGAVAVFVSSRQQLEKIQSIQQQIPALRHVIAFDPASTGSGALSLDQVCARGRAARARHPDWQQDALKARPDDLATLIYTSGTTGDQKGVMLTHGNITSNVTTCCKLFSFSEDDECLSFLPLSHIFERMFGHYSMFHSGVLINYAESVDTVAGDMERLRPMLMASVPRLYEKIYGRVLERVRAGSALQRRLFFWAKAVGETWVDQRLAGRPISPALSAKYFLADRLVFAKLRARTGGRLRFFISGGAPLSAEIARFFHAAGMPILEGYGLTETSPVIAVNTFKHLRLGTVGRPIPGVEVKIAEDGEILTRGPNVMTGYYRKAAATAEAIDPDGWFHTGDIGRLDEAGFLKITDRKKDLIVTAGGKNIAPQPIESRAKTCKFVSNAVMLGDRRRFPIMLIVPNYETLGAWATKEGLPTTDMAALLARPEVQAKMEKEIGVTLQDLAHFELPKKLLLLPRDFSVEAGELTPTLKIKRRVVEARHRDAIEALYGDG
ncbi:MAG TPA: long-chain fatty acid--CoA ligase [Gemmatimonadales bacterium]|nr:long-chain fatty acid--CoA ligase [Gemmatimonadales bacterium]